jgi:hypothetical protein
MKDPQRYRALEGCSPVTAIRAGDTDENDATAADVAWESFLNTRAVGWLTRRRKSFAWLRARSSEW